MVPLPRIVTKDTAVVIGAPPLILLVYPLGPKLPPATIPPGLV
ncbi:MAG: hypothetical protein WDO24_16980 [Pseudomonadota bacterium]